MHHLLVIIHHYAFYFENKGVTFKDTNGEYVEALHNSLRIHEENHHFKVVKKLGSADHLKKSFRSLAAAFNFDGRASFLPKILLSEGSKALIPALILALVKPV